MSMRRVATVVAVFGAMLGAHVAVAAPPAAPTGLTATLASPSQVNLSWTRVTGAAAYRVLRGTVSGGPYSQIGMCSAPNFSNMGLALNKTYYYVVQAYNGTFSPSSAQVSATTGTAPAPQVPPSPPTNLTATAVSGRIALTWTASTDAAVYHYDILRGTTSGGEVAVDSVQGNVTAYDDFNAPAAAGLYYQVRAYGAYGSSTSLEVFVPGAPTLTATALDDLAIRLSWSASTGATSYHVYRSASPAGPFTSVHAVVSASPTPSYDDSPVSSFPTVSETYYYHVQAVTSGGSGTGASLLSNQATATTTLVPAPSGFSATGATHVTIDLSWTPVGSLAPDADGYLVTYDTTPSTGPFTKVVSGAAASATQLTGLTPSTTYSIQIQTTTPSNPISALSPTVTQATTAPPAGLRLLAGTHTANFARGSYGGVSPDPVTNKLYHFDSYLGGVVREYPDVPSLVSDTNARTIALAQPYQGTQHAALNGFLYYNIHATNTIVKVRVTDGAVVASMPFPAAGHTNAAAYQWGGYSDMCFYVDSGNTLYMIWAANSGSLANVTQLDPNTLATIQTWTLPITKTGQMGFAFIVNGVVYIGNPWHKPNVNSTYTLATSTLAAYSNSLTPVAGEYITSVTWNPGTGDLFECTGNGANRILVYPNVP